tara:strand:+ start:4339 stop:5847 length:1509 start_codon:yes stop_codon:yes gene_type:complete
MPVKLNDGKTKRKNGGNGGLEGMTVFQPTYDDLIHANEIAEHKYNDILKTTNANFKAANDEYDEHMKQIHKETGYAESKHTDENENPNKKTKMNNDTKIAAAEDKINTIMDTLNKERDIAEKEYNAERTRIQNGILMIKEDDKRAKEQAEIEERNIKTAMEKMKQNKGTYLSPYGRSNDDINVDQRYPHQSILNTAHQNLREHYSQKNDMGLPVDFGGKRKTQKNKKSNKRKTDKSKKQKGGGAVYSRPGRRSPNRNIIDEDDPNTIDEYLETAIEEEAPRQVKEYLAAGANPNITILDEHMHLHEDVRPEPEDIPAILYAARHIKPSTIMKHLVERGASIEQYHNTGTTPLIEAAEYGNLGAVRYLLSIGADINATTGSGVPAIVYAVMNEDIPMIRFMLNKRDGKIDLDYTVFDTDRENVIDDAVKNAADPEVARILKEYANKIKHKNMRDARLVMEKGTYTDGRPLLPRARRDVASMVSKFLGGKTRKSTKTNRKTRRK